MSPNNDEVLVVLKEIRDTLSRIYTCFEEQYQDIQSRKIGDRLTTLQNILTPVRKSIFPLLFDSRRLSQSEIAREIGSNRSTVSKFLKALLELGLIEQIEDDDGTTRYHDTYDLATLLRLEEEQQ